MKRVCTIILICCYCLTIQSQTPLFKADFDDGTADDAVMGFDGTNLGAEVDCGVKTNGYSFDGNAGVSFPGEVTSYLSTAFTLSFYMQVDNTEDGLVSILSARSECERDSSFSISYFPPSKQLTVEFAENRIDFYRLAATVSDSKCWQYVVITYSLAEISLYINNELKDRIESVVRPIVIDSSALFNLATSPCIGDTESGLMGKLDEVCIFDRALDEREITNAYLMPDEIITRDTSIFSGGSVAVVTGGTCSNDFSWTPTAGVNDPQDAEPIFSPTVTTQYNWTVNYDNCSTMDSFMISVINPDDIDCDQISLPTAFTPNGDGLNDSYGISNPIIVENLTSFEIFDKWGAKMFSTNNKNGRWDGLYYGAIPNTNNFIYKVNFTCKGESTFKVGSFTILR